MAYGTAHLDSLAPDVMQSEEMEKLFRPLPFGFVAHSPGLREIASKIASDEGRAVGSRREKLGIETAVGMDATGLALSGGGIRSATFGLGVVQVLAEKGFLKEVDFLSTVSGGGYTGCFLTQALGNGEDQSTVAAPHGPDTDPVRYVRQNAKYLLVGNLKEQWSMVTATLAGMILNWTAPLLVILSLAAVVSQVDGWGAAEYWKFTLGGAAVLCGLAMVVYAWGVRMGKRTSQVTGSVLGILLALTVGVSIAWVLERSVPELTASGYWRNAGSLGAVLAALAAAVPGVVRFLPVLKNPNTRRLVLKVALVLAGFLIPLIALLLFHAFLEIASEHFTALLCVAAGLAGISIFLLNVNLTGPHRLYRDGLARTFIQRTASGNPHIRLDEINAGNTAPYHLLNSALNIPTSSDSALKDRRCDFFLFSKNWTGSPATGYHPTASWRTNGKPPDLATAMAISGAAFSSHMGLASMPTLTALLTILNVRLGFWIKRPDTGGMGAPGFICLLREMTSIRMSEKEKWLNLSDGGHIENLAIYELLRRRCKFIVCVDGESDPGYTFEGLMTLVRHAQIDFGVRLDPKLDELRPDPKTGYSKCHFHLCRIHYPEGIGLLLYIKLSVTGNESELIRRFRTNNSDFPHQTTLDQFFDQEQFEAYRQLGVHAAESVFLPALMDGGQPANVRDWFRQLAKNLLEPVRSPLS